MINDKLSKIKILAFKIRRINEKIENLRYEMEYHTSIYSELPKNINYRNNMIEIFISRIEELEIKKIEIQVELDKILDEFTFLSEISYKILVYRCIENLPWDQIVQKTGYSKPSCFRFYNEIKKYNSS